MAVHDFETQVFNALANALDAQFDEIYVVSEDLPGSETHFPLVKFVATDLSPDASSAESGDMETRTHIEFEAQCFSNTDRIEAKELAEACDDLMSSWGWHRTTLMPMDNADKTIRRYVARWRGSVGADGYVAR